MLNRNQPGASSPEHCDDAQLMAFLSDDLPAAEQARVEGHLALCWSCKERHLALRDTMRRIRQTSDEENVIGRAQIERARREFLTRFAALESELEVERIPAFTPLSPARGATFAARLAVAAAILCALGASVWLAFQPTRVQFDDVLGQTLVHENGLRRPQGPLHQQFEIEIQQVKPVWQRRSGVLRVWYDSAGERFAGRWERDDGKLQYAVWRPQADREFVFNAQRGATAIARTPQSGQAITLGELKFEEASIEQLETGFLYWLSNRRWEPISIASDVNVFRMREGVVAEVESVTTVDGRPAYRITARRHMDWGLVELVAEVDAQTYQPKIESLRLVSADSVVELRLRAQRTQWLPSGAMENALFWPSVDIESGREAVGELRPAPPPRRPETRESGDWHSAVPSELQLDLAEMRVRYALHQAGACLGVPIRVVRVRPGSVHVEGLVDSVERKQELFARLADISAAPFVSTDIQTVDEALLRSSPDEQAGERGGWPPREDSARRGGETLEVVATDSPIRDALQRYLRQAHDSAATQTGSRDEDIQKMASEFSDGVISSSLANLTEAWALRRLVERYRGSASELPEPAAALLREMLAAHVSALRTRTASIQEQLRPLLSTLAPVSGPVAPEPSREQDWAAQSLRVFQEIESTEAITTGLFADSGYADGVRRETSSKHAAAALLRALPQLEDLLQSLEKHLTALEQTPMETGLAGDLPPARNRP